MTKMSKIKIEARRRAQSANRKVRNSERKLSGARVDAQLAAIEELIASLQARSAALKEGDRGKGIGKREEEGKREDVKTETLSPVPCSLSPQAKANPPGGNDPATFLITWLEEQQIMFGNFADLMPELENTVLTTSERRRLLGSGVRRYGFIDKVSDTAVEYPQFWPASVHGTVEFQTAIKDRLREIEALRNLMAWQHYVNRVTGDLLLLAGNDAFRMANTYYASVRSAARSRLPGAQALYELLRSFFRKPRRPGEEPTERELMRNVCALYHGSKDGTVTIHNESDQRVRGKRVLVDNTHKKPRGGVKIVEKGEVE